MESSRRVFLQALAASTAVAMVAGRSGAVANPVPKLTTWTPPGGWGTFGKPRRILEIYLRGGASLC